MSEVPRRSFTTKEVRSHAQNSKEAGVSKDMLGPELLLGDKGLSSGATKLNSIFITAERRQNENLQAFMDRFKSESSHIKRVPPVLRISDFMHGHGHSKLAKKLNDKIPKTVDEMFKRVRAFIRGEVVTGSVEMVRPSQGDKGYIRLAWTGGPEKARNSGGP
ncbi:hypothetical protein Tco_0086377 [Tanacetum coccineum]